MALDDERYMLFTTFRRDGTPVSTPVWVVGLDAGTVGFTTSSRSGKAKRLAHTARVTVQPCNARGRVRPGTSPVEASARLVTGDEMQAVRARIVAKYRVEAKLMSVARAVAGMIGRRMPENDRGVVVTLGTLG